ncbi:inositol monophosphatase [Desulfovibrio desulfuricans]|uniref:Inositol-1-monophosphatase n=1 Tax=Desulfovibrio desulfuricans TaxID=876 RepID=A0A4P7UKX7_DESDE|nr:inositol monophosphatase family protein [Desulfovibrio desulfuricans]QCC85488.1 inositol monophosphatase [Desulfovibrio desulfuricans]
MFSSQKVLQECMEIVLQSGNIVREHWARPSNVMHKGRIDLVTQTDLAVEAFLKEKLAGLVPGAAFMAEESSQSEREPDGLCWIIDPVDGTTNFVHRIPQVATSVALWHNGRAELGVVNIPMMHECFSARRGQGAFVNDVPLAVSKAQTLGDSLVATGFPYDFTGRLDRVLARLALVLPKSQGLRRMGAAAVDLAYVACGRVDMFYEEGLKPWDFAAGMLLVEEAGGKVTNMRGDPLHFGDVLLASNGLVHEESVALLGPTDVTSGATSGAA